MQIDEEDEDAEPMEMFSCDILPDVEVAKRVRETDQVSPVHSQAGHARWVTDARSVCAKALRNNISVTSCKFIQGTSDLENLKCSLRKGENFQEALILFPITVSKPGS